ncbi:hypothetical protein Scep_018522 [Stephania cephalantha]|uniref:RRM domain-containing protein n=1 Tax=Stephania cephalantha TaxID=152367 RepID=A0AAP0I9E8_9MAGN
MAHHQHYRSQFGDTTFTKVFVGGLAWETQTQEMRRYFEQFGDILEAVIITDKTTGRSKGYGFVTFRDPESASRACADPNPMIDGRRANCNIASLGRPRPSPPRGRSIHQGGPGNPYHGVNAPPFNQVGAPLPPPPPPPPPPPAPTLFYPPYMYATYSPDYGYPRALYNPYIQQAQYYHQQQHQHQQHHHHHQLYGGGGGGGGGGGASSSSPTVGPSPQYYGYSWQTPFRGGTNYYSAPQAHGIRGPSFLQYPLQPDSHFSPPPPPPLLPPPNLPLSTSTTTDLSTTTGGAGVMTTSESPET